MADAGVDIAALTEDQQLALQTYTAVTDQEIDKAIPLLQRCQWNAQIAITRFFDGEPAEDPVAAATAAQPAPQDIRRQETLLNGFTSSPRSSTSSARRVRIEPAPRVVPQPESQVSTQVPLVLAVLFAPLSLVYSLVGKWFRFMGWLFPFLPRAWGRVTASNINTPASRRSASGRRPLNPRDTAARFIREFEEEYGSHQLPFFESGYAQAFDLAKKNLQFLMVVLISPEHDETASFVRDTLLSSEVVEFIRDPANSIIIWAGNVQDSEAYQVASALSCTKFPFTGLIVHTPQVSSTAMGIATRIAGPTPPSQFISKLRTAMQQHTQPLERARNQRAEQQATRNIRQQQDSAYERSLATDRERARKKKEEAERKAREEKEALEHERAIELYAQNLDQWRRWRASLIASEPGPDEKDIVRISLRMPNADRVVRKFAADAPIEELYAFVECYDILQSPQGSSEKSDKPQGFEHEYKFQLVSPIPREVIEFKAGGTIKARIGRSGNLIVERTDLEGDEDEDDDEDDE
ncbi:uncharacterized protein K460DRAFT_357784 [Cucurbitaria berberidis CBS 394.84]|uniref:UBX domain-containing protein n=1 Tax=Cucurbitaria berberidis CBS 394.84 TaxID=1168544 RepID=A0A9P4L6T3_9PLEO|nr:uncharacterized protein K460DRAFT_357784 [Cucurbitaria berberidis CBS 394.84]KAF1844160.1 hypothetical protein K460DRAFT_357784 [Cucurbitaria berberidis CBS 394.84]